MNINLNSRYSTTYTSKFKSAPAAKPKTSSSSLGETTDFGFDATYFLESKKNWKEGAHKSELTAEELSNLKEKYNSRNMTDNEEVDLLGELVSYGVLTIKQAGDIFFGAVPIVSTEYSIGPAEVVPGFYFESVEDMRNYHCSTSNWIERNTDRYNATLKWGAGKQEHASLTDGYRTYLDVLKKLDKTGTHLNNIKDTGNYYGSISNWTNQSTNSENLSLQKSGDKAEYSSAIDEYRSYLSYQDALSKITLDLI